jgi:hypothetical protein
MDADLQCVGAAFNIPDELIGNMIRAYQGEPSAHASSRKAGTRVHALFGAT